MTTPSPRIATKAIALLEQHRVWMFHNGTDAWTDTIRVAGATATYLVTAYPLGVHCSCKAGANLDLASCSHKVAAQIAWAES